MGWFLAMAAAALLAVAPGQSPELGTPAPVSDSTTFTLTNAATGTLLGVAGQSQAAGAVMAQSAGSMDPFWHGMPMKNDQYSVENMLTHQVMGVAGGSTAVGARVAQWADDGAADHLWEFSLLPDGNYLVRNAKSGLYLEDAGAGVIDQGARAAGAGCAYQEWRLTDTGRAAYPEPEAVKLGWTGGRGGSVHDPSMVKAGSTYYLFGTHGAIHAYASADRVNFADAGSALAEVPAWTRRYNGGRADLWAPDVSVHGGKYWLYYAASTFGSANSAIGLALSATGAPGTYVDSGAAVYTSSECPGANAIDPASVVDSSGNAWMMFGSWSNGLHIVRVNNVTGLPTGAACRLLARRANGLEGGFVYRRGRYYYLFGSVNRCCAGVGSSYRIVVGRSTEITGPYRDRGGLAMTAGGGTVLLSAHGRVNGPGGQTVMADTDGEVLVYHFYDGDNQGVAGLGLNHLAWTADGWPVVVP